MGNFWGKPSRWRSTLNAPNIFKKNQAFFCSLELYTQKRVIVEHESTFVVPLWKKGHDTQSYYRGGRRRRRRRGSLIYTVWVCIGVWMLPNQKQQVLLLLLLLTVFFGAKAKSQSTFTRGFAATKKQHTKEKKTTQVESFQLLSGN